MTDTARFVLGIIGIIGAVCGQLSGIRTKNGRCFDYLNRLKMAGVIQWQRRFRNW